MTTQRFDTRTAGKEPGGRKRPLLQLLALGMLIPGIFWIAPVAMASGTDTGTHTGLMEAGPGGLLLQAGPNGSSVTGILAESRSPDRECTAHTVGCYNRTRQLIGTVGVGCEWWKFACQDNDLWDDRKCREVYGNNFAYAKSLTPCYWESS